MIVASRVAVNLGANNVLPPFTFALTLRKFKLVFGLMKSTGKTIALLPWQNLSGYAQWWLRPRPVMQMPHSLVKYKRGENSWLC